MNKGLQVGESLLSEIFRRWRILLNAFKMLDCQISVLALFIDDGSKLVVLSLNFLDNLLFDAFLLHHSGLHVIAIMQGSVCIGK